MRRAPAALGDTRFRDASCGSATTDDSTSPQTGLPLGGTNAPQFDRLSPRTRLVTVGGDDVGISSGGLDCRNLLPVENPMSDTGPGLPLGGCRRPTPTWPTSTPGSASSTRW